MLRFPATEYVQCEVRSLYVALSPDDARLYVSLLTNSVVVIGRVSRTVVATITTGGEPRRLGFSSLGETVVIADMSGKVHFVR